MDAAFLFSTMSQTYAAGELDIASRCERVSVNVVT